MVTVVIAVLATLALAALAAQLLIPRIAERRIGARLVENGGEARIHIRAFPAIRLLRNAGDRLEVRGNGLVIGLAPGQRQQAAVAADRARRSQDRPRSPRRRSDLTPGATSAPGRSAGLSALDGFEEVDIELVDFRTGPFAVDAFVLERSGGANYAMAVRGQTTPSELAALGLEALPPIPGGSLLESVAGAAPLGSRSFAVSLEIELISEPGDLRVGAGGGSIAGYPAGPFAATIAAAVARRLEIVP